MYRSDPEKAFGTMRLFPRLAVTNSARQVSRRRARVAVRDNAVPDTDPTATARAEVKARLLRMILDNEQVRRNGQRPNQV